MDQHAGTKARLLAQQGAFELPGKIHRAVFYHHRADRQHLILVEIQATGFQVQHDPALLAQGAGGQWLRRGEPVHTLLQFVGQGCGARSSPGKQIHS